MLCQARYNCCIVSADTESMTQLGTTAPVLSKIMCETAYSLLVQNPEDQKSELVDLNHAPSVKNLPPAYIVTAEYDPLRDEGEYYAARLFKNNVPVSLLTVSCDVGAGPGALVLVLNVSLSQS